MKKIIKDQRALSYEIIHKKIKHTYFRVQADTVLVSTSKQTPSHVIEAYLYQHFDKLYARIEHSSIPSSDEHIKLWGNVYKINLIKGPFTYKIEDQTLSVSSRLTDIKRIIKMIYLEEIKKAIQHLDPLVYQIISKDGVRLRNYQFKYLKSKFGSYHKKQDFITLNTFLATQDQTLLFYVMLHEYAHVLVFNHSKSFYNVLDRWLPNHRELQKRLKSIAIY